MTLSGNILITGGAGTLGNAIVRMAYQEAWNCTITIYSRSELLQSQMRQKYPYLRYVLGDVRDYERLESAIAGHDIVIHAAAMKRIPEAEQQPTECYATNIYGSTNVIRACIAQGVERCIGISTDKACSAVTAYGASKLAMEKVFQAAPANTTTFTLVRYGNVVASRGSVIPLWRAQAAADLPVTITDKRCTRFWMTEDDAVNLVKMASNCTPGIIVVPKMKALPVVEMAKAIAPDSELLEIGLRSCEKLHEDLVHLDELAEEKGQYFFIGKGKTGYKYTSEHAPRLSAEQFLSMLEIAEEYEQQAA
jgi:UDP-N-acetylglucosamine 4,6-dehydratase/5-epimerase